MNTATKVILALLAIAAGIYALGHLAPHILGLLFLVEEPKGDGPKVIEISHSLSPDGQWEFSAERIDNGLGFGLGRVYDEVHVHRPGVRTFDHGDKETTSVFYIEETDNGRVWIRVLWSGAHHLTIYYPAGLTPGRSVRRMEDVDIVIQSE